MAALSTNWWRKLPRSGSPPAVREDAKPLDSSASFRDGPSAATSLTGRLAGFTYRTNESKILLHEAGMPIRTCNCLGFFNVAPPKLLSDEG